MTCVRQKNRTEYRQHIFFVVCLAVYSAVTLWLFHRQSVSYGGRYTSDMISYIAHMQGIDSGFAFPYPIYFWVGKLFHLFFNPELSMALATTLLNSLGAAVLYAELYRFRSRTPGWKRPDRYGMEAGLLTFALLLMSMIYPLTQDYLSGAKDRYLGTFTPNPYHNATYLAARPFMLLCFFAAAEVFADYGERKHFTKESAGIYLRFSLWLLLATMTKPSFTIVFGVTSVVLLLVRQIASRGRNWSGTWRLGLCYLPTILDLMYQYAGVFISGSGEAAESSAETAGSLGIGIGWCTAWSMHSDLIPLAV